MHSQRSPSRTDRGAAQVEHDSVLDGGPAAAPRGAEAVWTAEDDAQWRSREDMVLPQGASIQFYDFRGARDSDEGEEDDDGSDAEFYAQEPAAGSLTTPAPSKPSKPPLLVYEPSPALVGRLNTGAEIPLIGLGTWKSAPGAVRDAVKFALVQGGYRHIDCASIYENEHEVGAALTDVFGSTNLRREQVFVCSKLWNTVSGIRLQSRRFPPRAPPCGRRPRPAAPVPPPKAAPLRGAGPLAHACGGRGSEVAGGAAAGVSGSVPYPLAGDRKPRPVARTEPHRDVGGHAGPPAY